LSAELGRNETAAQRPSREARHQHA
jgi:hypothetical protein